MLICGLAATLAGQSYRSVYVIPRGLVELTKVIMTNSELVYFLTLSLAVTYFLTTGIVVFRKKRGWLTAQAGVEDTFSLIIASTLAVTFYFVGTEKNFSPNFFVSFLGLAVVLRLAWLIAAAALKSELRLAIGVFGSQLVRPFGLVTVFIGLLPGLLLVGYKKDRNIANIIHKTRRAISQSDKTPYFVKPLYADLVFEQPIEVEFDKSGRLFVLERIGKLFLVEGQEKQLLLDFTSEVGEVAVENGALGFALHPEFGKEDSSNSNRVFVAYTHWQDNILKNRLSEFLLPERNTPKKIEQTVLIEQTRKNDGYHNAGAVEFGPDGYLYVAVGEATDHKNHQQIDHALYSGILRIDIDNKASSLPIRNQPSGGKTAGYKIPSDNPFIQNEEALHEFYAIGFRNPFRMTFDRQTGKLWAGEVGNITYEEVDIVVAGGNYQFPYAEGPKVGAKPKDFIGNEKPPYFYYTHTALNRAIIGGEVYRGSRFNDLTGSYLFGDNYSGRIMAIPAEGQTWSDEAKTIALLPHLGQMGLTNLIEGPDGEVYMTSLGKGGSGTGRIWLLTKEEQAVNVKMADAGLEDQMPPHQMFKQYCSRCHGLNGMGKQEVSAALNVEMANFQNETWQAKSSKDYIAKVILNGGAKMGLNAGMPAWSNVLSSKQANLLAEYIKQKLPKALAGKEQKPGEEAGGQQ